MKTLLVDDNQLSLDILMKSVRHPPLLRLSESLPIRWKRWISSEKTPSILPYWT